MVTNDRSVQFAGGMLPVPRIDAQKRGLVGRTTDNMKTRATAR
jgi:hypothetical protein